MFPPKIPDDPDAQYVIKYTERAPLIGAGRTHKTYATGDKARRATCAAIGEDHGRVPEVRKRGWFDW